MILQFIKYYSLMITFIEQKLSIIIFIAEH